MQGQIQSWQKDNLALPKDSVQNIELECRMN